VSTFLRLVNEYGRVCEWSKLSVNVRKRKVMKLKRKGNVDALDITFTRIRMKDFDSF
jgi:hypothetical protein